MNRYKLARLSLIPAAVLASGSAFAELPAAVTTAITGAQTDLVALFAALIAAGVAIWVSRIIYNKFKVK